MAIRTGRPVDRALSLARQSNGKTILLDQYTKGAYSPYFEVRDLPVIVQLIGIAAGSVRILTSVKTINGEIEQVLRLNRQDAILSLANNSLTIDVSGRYRAQLLGSIGNAVLVYGPQLTTDKVDIPQPSGAQANRPNLFLGNGDRLSQVLEIEQRAWVINAFGLTPSDEVEVLAVYGNGPSYREVPYAPEGRAWVMTAGNNSIVLDKSGRYRFRSLHSTAGKLLVGNPTMVPKQQSEGSGGGELPNNRNLITIAATNPTDGDILEFNAASDGWETTKNTRKLYLDGGNF